MPTSKSLSGAVCAVAILLAAGCGHDTESRTAVDTSALQPGNYRTTPRTTAEVRTPEAVATQEALRLAEFVPLIMDTAPEMVFGRVRYQRKMYTRLDPPELTENFSAEVPGFRVGWETVGQRREEQTLGRAVELTVLRFAEPGQATHAAKYLSDRAWTSRYPPVATIAIPGYADAFGQVGQYDSVSTWVSHGEYLVKTYIGAGVDIPPDHTALAELTRAVLDTQFERLREYRPASPEELPVDTDEMLRHALPAEEGESEAVMSPAVALHFSERPDLTKRAIEDAQVDLVVRGGTEIYRASDAEAAERFAAYLESRLDPAYETIDSPPGMPVAHCTENPEEAGSHRCVFTNGRYTVLVDGADQIQELHQRTAAQYLLLDDLT